MGGSKNKGQVMFGEADRGFFTPADSKINFAVSISKISDLNLSPLAPGNIKPGIIKLLLDKVVPTATKDKTYKIGLDGKKMNTSTSGKLGDVDLFGFEKQPTLQERKDRLESELKVSAGVLEILDLYDDKMFLVCILPTGTEKITTT
jgi:hypothetical protein